MSSVSQLPRLKVLRAIGDFVSLGKSLPSVPCSVTLSSQEYSHKYLNWTKTNYSPVLENKTHSVEFETHSLSQTVWDLTVGEYNGIFRGTRKALGFERDRQDPGIRAPINQKPVRSHSNCESTSIPLSGFWSLSIGTRREIPSHFLITSFLHLSSPTSNTLQFSRNFSKSRGKKDAIKNCLTTVCVSTIIWNNCTLGDSRQSINPQFTTQVAKPTLNE